MTSKGLIGGLAIVTGALVLSAAVGHAVTCTTSANPWVVTSQSAINSYCSPKLTCANGYQNPMDCVGVDPATGWSSPSCPDPSCTCGCTCPSPSGTTSGFGGGNGTCAAWEYQVSQGCDAHGNVQWGACTSFCTPWANGTCGGSGTYANGSVSCPGKILQTSTCSDGTLAPKTVAQCGATCTTACAPDINPNNNQNETNATSIANYCGACTGGKVEPTSLACHYATTGWAPFGTSCQAPYCNGCGCTCPSNLPVDVSGTCEQCNQAAGNAGICPSLGQVCAGTSCVAAPSPVSITNSGLSLQWTPGTVSSPLPSKTTAVNLVVVTNEAASCILQNNQTALTNVGTDTYGVTISGLHDGIGLSGTPLNYTVQCSANGTNASASFSVSVACPTGEIADGSGGCKTSAQPPTATFSASPTAIGVNQKSQLSWTTTNAASASIDNGVGPMTSANLASGSVQVQPQATVTYTLTVLGQDGSKITRSATVTVVTISPLALGMTAGSTPVPITTEDSLTFVGIASNWSVSSPCTIQGNVTNTSSVQVSPPASATTNENCTVTANVISPAVVVTVPISISPGGTSSPITITPGAFTLSPGGSQSFTAQDQTGDITTQATWSISGPCTITSLAGTTPQNVKASAVGVCNLTATSNGQSGTATITVANQNISNITVSPATANIMPSGAGSSIMLGFQAHDSNNNPTPMNPNYTVTGPCSLASTSSTPFSLTYYATIQAQSTAKAGDVCTVTAQSGNITSASAQLTISNLVLRIMSPANGQGFSIQNPGTDKVSVSGIVGGTSQVSLTIGGANVSATLSGTDPITGLPMWSGSWIPPGATASEMTTTASASAGGLTASDSRGFYVFFPPPAPSIAGPTTKMFAGTSFQLTGTTADNPSNPSLATTKNGIRSMFFFQSADGSGSPTPALPDPGQPTGAGWLLDITLPQRGTFFYSAKCLNDAGIYSPVSPSISVTLVQRPTIRLTVPQTGGVYTSGTQLTFTATVVDPDNLVSGVEFFNMGQSLGQASGSNGTYTLPAALTMAGGNPFDTITVVATYQDVTQHSQHLSVSDGPASITVVNPPSISIPAAASPNPVTGVSTQLTVGATSYFNQTTGVDNLTYQWADNGLSPAPVKFDFGGSARTLMATFSKAGQYNLHVTITDPAGGKSTSNVSISVQVGLQITPSSLVYAKTGGTVQFGLSGKDQFGNSLSLSGNPVWSTTCGAAVGQINPSSGLFTAGSTPGGPCNVIATSNGITGTASVTVTNNIPPVVSITSMAAVDPTNTNFQAPVDVILTAAATDADDAIKQVQFFANGQAVGPAVTQSPYTFTWTKVLPGDYYVTAMATDVNNASTVSSALPLAVLKPKLAITNMVPFKVTNTTYASTGASIEVDGTGFVAPPVTGLNGSVVLWGGQGGTPKPTTYIGTDYVTSKLMFAMLPSDFNNPGNFLVQVQNPDGTLSNPVQFIIDGQPIVKCVDLWHLGSCQNQPATTALTTPSAVTTSAAATTNANIPHLSRTDQISAITQFTGDGVQWSLFPAGAQITATTAGNGTQGFTSNSTILYQSSFVSGNSFNLSNLPAGLASGDYTIVAVGMNLAGAVSAPAEASFFLTAADLSSVRVYPDPWRSDQDSAYPIKFDRMAPGSTVKIFTVSGHWVQTLTADGSGVATWDRKNSGGELVQSGLYLFLVTDPQGNKVHGKFAIIR